MKATTNIDMTKAITHSIAGFEGNDNAAAGAGQTRGKPESELRAAARRHGLNLKELAERMGVNYGYLSSVASGRRPWTPLLKERATAVLGEVPGQGVVYRQGGLVQGVVYRQGGLVQGVVYRQGGLVQGESTCIRERARELGLTQKELAHRVGVSVGYMSEVARGRKNMSPEVQARVERALGGPVEIAPAQCANRQDGVVKGRGQSSYIRERARELGFSLKGLAEHVGVSSGYMTQVSRGERSMSPAVQARVETALDGPARIEPAQPPTLDPRALWDRMDAHEISQNETARLAGISSGHLSQIMNGQRNASGEVLAKLYGVLFRPTAAELVVPAEVKVMAWKKGGRNGVVVRGAGGPGAGGNQPGGGTVRIGGRVPWGAEVEYAYRAGYDSRGQVSVTHLVDERGYGRMLTQPEPDGVGPREDRTGV